jgi:hypothetical protein
LQQPGPRPSFGLGDADAEGKLRPEGAQQQAALAISAGGEGVDDGDARAVRLRSLQSLRHIVLSHVPGRPTMPPDLKML